MHRNWLSPSVAPSATAPPCPSHVDATSRVPHPEQGEGWGCSLKSACHGSAFAPGRSEMRVRRTPSDSPRLKPAYTIGSTHPRGRTTPRAGCPILSKAKGGGVHSQAHAMGLRLRPAAARCESVGRQVNSPRRKPWERSRAKPRPCCRRRFIRERRAVRRSPYAF